MRNLLWSIACNMCMCIIASIAYGVDGEVFKNLAGSIVYISNTGDRICVYDCERAVNRCLEIDGQSRDPKWSPDGKMIAFASKRNGHSWEIYVMNSDASCQIRVTFTNNGHSTEPRWDRSGSGIYFLTKENNGPMSENYIDLMSGKITSINSTDRLVGVTGRQVKTVIDGASDSSIVKYLEDLREVGRNAIADVQEHYLVYPSPGGDLLLNWPYGSEKMLLLKNGTKKDPRHLPPGIQPSWSRDGLGIAYFVGESPKRTLAVYDAVSMKMWEYRVSISSHEECRYPSWSRDSKKIAFSCGPVVGLGESWICIFDLERKATEKLFLGRRPDWK